jgi:hypothetical protein
LNVRRSDRRRARQQRRRLFHISTTRLDQAEEMEGMEIIGIRRYQLAIQDRRFAEAALLVQRMRGLQLLPIVRRWHTKVVSHSGVDADH